MIRDHAKQNGVQPVWVALAIAIFGLLAMLVVDHGPWSHPHVQTAAVANHQTTGDSARAGGADRAQIRDRVRSTWPEAGGAAKPRAQLNQREINEC
jgi:hypothetical protein